MFDRRSATLLEHCQRLGLTVDPDSWQSNSASYRTRETVREIAALIPAGESFILADHGAWSGPGEPVAGRRRIPFLERDGKYFGPPADAATALREFERLRAGGAGFMVFAGPAFWWRD